MDFGVDLNRNPLSMEMDGVLSSRWAIRLFLQTLSAAPPSSMTSIAFRFRFLFRFESTKMSDRFPLFLDVDPQPEPLRNKKVGFWR